MRSEISYCLYLPSGGISARLYHRAISHNHVLMSIIVNTRYGKPATYPHACMQSVAAYVCVVMCAPARERIVRVCVLLLLTGRVPSDK